MTRASACAALAVVLASAAPRPARAGDPELVWRTIDTKHFVISYHLAEERLAQHLAVAAEEAHRKLAPLLDHAPRFKTYVVLSDETDDANGSATVLPYRQVRLFATAPDDRSELNDYDDWLSALITHEYTHILHLDTIHGIARIVNYILGFGERGQLYVPNQFQPRFLIEGLAVFEETERTSAGRLRSTIYDMFLRTASLAGRFQRLDQFANYPIQWPRGASPYLYGSAFLRYVASLYGPDVFRRLSHEYGGNWIPGAMNRALRRVTGGKGTRDQPGGRTFAELYDGFRASMADRYGRKLAEIEAAGRVEGTPLTAPREYVIRPIFTPDGRSVVWSDSDGVHRPRFARIPVLMAGAGGAPGSLAAIDTVLPVDAAGSGALSPDGKTLYFNAVEVYRTGYYWNDLFALDLATGEKRQLTHGLRAEGPALSPDGTTLAFAANESSSRSLLTMPAGGGRATRLIGNLDDLGQIYTPAWSPDGKTIAVSWWRDGGYRDIWTIDVQTRALTRITADRALDLDPRYSPDGKYLYFASDRTGVYNLFAWEVETGRFFQVSNVVGGVFDPAISPDGRTCVFVGFAADGYRLEQLALDPARFRPATEATVDRPEAEPIRVTAPIASRPYNPLATMWPHSFGFALYPDAFGQVLAINLNGGDIVGFHSWNASIGISLAKADDVALSLSYSYNRLFPAFGFSAYRQLLRRGGLFFDAINRAYVEDDYSASAAVDFPILRLIDKSADLSFNYNLAYLRNADPFIIPLDPSLISPRLPEVGRVASLGMGFSYGNTHRYTYSVSTQEGRALSFNLGLSQKILGSQYNVATAYWRYSEFIPMPWDNHVLSLSYGGGISGGDIRRRGAFYLGGHAPQADILRSIFDFSRPGGASLRGYPYSSIYGDQFHVLNVEYKFPIAWVERGYQTFPLYLRRLHGAVFADLGNAFYGSFDPRKLKLGVGAEVRLDLYLFYYFGSSLQLGYARGFMEGGGNEIYFYLNNSY